MPIDLRPLADFVVAQLQNQPAIAMDEAALRTYLPDFLLVRDSGNMVAGRLIEEYPIPCAGVDSVIDPQGNFVNIVLLIAIDRDSYVAKRDELRAKFIEAHKVTMSLRIANLYSHPRPTSH